MRIFLLFASVLFNFMYLSSALAWQIAFSEEFPDFPKDSKLYVEAGVNPGVPLIFDFSDHTKVVLRPSRKKDRANITRPEYIFEWEDKDTAMFYKMHDPEVLKKLSKSNAKDVATPGGQQYEINAIQVFFQNGKLLKKCVPSSFAGEITSYLVIDKNGSSEHIVVLPEGKIAKCIEEASKGIKLPVPPAKFVAKASVKIEVLEAKKIEKKSELQCYMPYAESKDHLVSGCEISGYHMQYDLAKQSGAFMIILPNGSNSLDDSSHYFSIQTLSFEGGTLQSLFENDVKNLIDEKPGTKVVKRLSYTLPAKNGGMCIGAEMKYPSNLARFPNETFYICKSDSSKYALLLALGAKNRNAMNIAIPAFTNWMNVPQSVRDMTIKIYDFK